eukprot:Pgem_evm1s16261
MQVSTVTTVLATLFVSGAQSHSQHYYTPWFTNNWNGWYNKFVSAAHPSRGSGQFHFETREQSTFGVINLNIDHHWVNGNFNGFTNPTFTYPKSADIIGMAVKEQGGYGIVDIGLIPRGSGLPFFQTGNPNGWKITHMCPSGYQISGVETREQGGYGLVNLRARCTKTKCESQKRHNAKCKTDGDKCLTDGSFQLECATCEEGWTGVKCNVDVNECKTGEHECAAGVPCFNNGGSYSCGACPIGSTGDGKTCTPIKCKSQKHKNKKCLKDGKQCLTDGSNFLECAKCVKGWTGEKCEVDVNECKTGDHQCADGVACINHQGSYRCGECPKGTKGDGFVCVPIDEKPKPPPGNTCKIKTCD